MHIASYMVLLFLETSTSIDEESSPSDSGCCVHVSTYLSILAPLIVILNTCYISR